MKTKALVCLLLCSVATVAGAQTYRCSSKGRPYLSDRPCTAEATLNAYGPVPTYPQYFTAVQAAPKIQDHVQYLSASCASISEAIRTGPSRGVRHDVIRALRDEYTQKCSLEDRDAHQKARGERNAQSQAQASERQSALSEKQRARELVERCNGMRDVISLKRKRESGLNENEVAALRGLEKTYNETCLSR